MKNYVHLCASLGWNSLVAIKIIRGMKKYRDATMIEVAMLQQLAKHDNGENHCVQIRKWFDYRNHICIVFEKLGPRLYDFLRKNNYHSFSIDLVLMHDLRLIHTYLKPENILLTFPEYVKVPDYKVSSRSPKDGSYYKRIQKLSAIKVIDFGSTIYVRLNQTYVVSTRHYCAPEVILEFQDSQRKSLPTFLEVQYCNGKASSLEVACEEQKCQNLRVQDSIDTFSCSSSSSEVKSSPLFDRPPDKKFHIYGNSQLGSRVIPLFEDYNDNMDVPDENINEDSPLSHREYKNFCFVRKQLLQIENQQSTLLDLLQGFNGSSRRKKRIARDDETASFFISVGLTGLHSLIAYNIKLEP
ncbi:Serine/threonine-protein kinase AFC2 [Capsicum baccatum]|uniref:Serine/threonine-protein kinase AFC2 n=1 Tax=Capsicum baccatum TaxID=33114 RepID=A0A2G2WIK1_CAPBA|nr:Serine/threonine-protein kinase AFC2 [Capsicum baccatum]